MRKANRSTMIVMGCGVLLAGLLACGGGGTSAPPSGGGAAATEAPATQAAADTSVFDSLDPCTVLTQDDANGIFGTTAVSQPHGRGSNTLICSYSTSDNVDSLGLNLVYLPNGAAGSDEFAVAKSGQAVPGLGDGAFWLATVSQLDIAKGPWLVTLSGSVGGTNLTLDQLTPLAQTVLGRLP